jgi:hypothetical protein
MKQECILERRPFSKDGRFHNECVSDETSIIIVNIGSRTHGGISVQHYYFRLVEVWVAHPASFSGGAGRLFRNKKPFFVPFFNHFGSLQNLVPTVLDDDDCRQPVVASTT